MRIILPLIVVACSLIASVAHAEAVPKTVVQETVAAVGGEEKLLKLFRMKEVLAVSSDPEKKGSPRTSVLEPPAHWWLGKKDRVTQEKEPATFLVWGWTLGALVDPKSTLETLPDAKVGDRPVYGISISGTITPPMKCYFDRETKRLATIEWRADRHEFSDWRQVDGTWYPAKCVGFKLADNKRWYGTEIIEIERLKELPEGLAR
ncbi:MAG: hypothetical protein JNM18_14355 [Planctomycetaceae bacterium]|nr:hypothetical protein [Planctomycetaceae bacterium]